jgi:chemotaxis protein histidine kinase CheA
LLFDSSDLGADIRNQVKEAANCIINEDQMNYAFNSHALIQEYQLEVNGHNKILALDWNPIVLADTVQKLMVCVRDVTELKKMESESRAQKRELEIISQLLNVSSKKFKSFQKSVSKFVQINREALQACERLDSNTLTLLFRNMHTVKGNSRTFGFSYISDIAHQVESSYSQAQKNPDQLIDHQRLLSELEKVQSVLAEYEQVYYRVLGREQDGGDRDNQVILDKQALEAIQKAIITIQSHFGQRETSEDLKPLNNVIDRAASSTIEEMFTDIFESLQSVADQLGKPNPKIVVDTDGVRIREDAYDLFNNVFVHILRNSIDHGIERTEERLANDKDEVGTIYVSTRKEQDRLITRVRDDGRGLNIKKLFAIGSKLRGWGDNCLPSRQEVADLIFTSGVSTTEEITDISGRGVGMDAAKHFLQEIGGDIKVCLLDENSKDLSSFAKFELTITLPASQFIP